MAYEKLKSKHPEIEKAMKLLREAAEGDENYGHFPGGDPRGFKPDEEVCTADEIARWKAACEAAEKDPSKRSLKDQHNCGLNLYGGRKGPGPHDDGFGLGTTMVVFETRAAEAYELLKKVFGDGESDEKSKGVTEESS